jgi:nanoRNase/pAp phosphatase (c-di-AMP/oligoRNAs hydrolase)
LTRAISFSELCGLLKERRNSEVILTFHAIGDRDGVGSAVALSEYFENATVATPDFLTSNAKRMLERSGYDRRIGAEFPKGKELVVVLDANNLDVLGKFKESIMKFAGDVLFVDHHITHADGLPAKAIMFNSEAYNSTASIVYAALKEIGAEITRSMAFTLLNGVIADSADLNNSSPQTFRQIADLIEISKADFSFISEYLHASIPVGNRYETIKGVCAAKTEAVGDYIIMYGAAAEHANVAADAAQNLGADASVFWVSGKREASLSARLRPPLDKELGIHLGTIMQGVAQIVGGTGGGHACAAGAYGPKRESAHDAAQEVVRKIKEKLQRGKVRE